MYFFLPHALSSFRKLSQFLCRKWLDCIVILDSVMSPSCVCHQILSSNFLQTCLQYPRHTGTITDEFLRNGWMGCVYILNVQTFNYQLHPFCSLFTMFLCLKQARLYLTLCHDSFYYLQTAVAQFISYSPQIWLIHW